MSDFFKSASGVQKLIEREPGVLRVNTDHRPYVEGDMSAEKFIAKLFFTHYPNSSDEEKFLQHDTLLNFFYYEFDIYPEVIEVQRQNAGHRPTREEMMKIQLQQAETAMVEVAKEVLGNPSDTQSKKWRSILTDLHTQRHNWIKYMCDCGEPFPNISHYENFSLSEPSVMLNWVLDREKYKQLWPSRVISNHRNGYFFSMPDVLNELISEFLVG